VVPGERQCATMCYMRPSQVGVRELRQNLSVHLRKVKAGQVLEVTEHGIPVAQLAPLHPSQDPIERLAAEGLLLRRATKRLEDLPPPLRIDLPVPLSKILDDLREERL